MRPRANRLRERYDAAFGPFTLRQRKVYLSPAMLKRLKACRDDATRRVLLGIKA